MTDTEKRYLSKIDEINRLFYKPTETYDNAESLMQAVHDYLVDMYLEGYASTGFLLSDKERRADSEIIEELLLLEIDGKTLYDRIYDYYAVGTGIQTPETENEPTEASEGKNEPISDKKTETDRIIPDGAVFITADVAIARVIETEAHRMYNNGGFDRAVAAGAKKKKWQTMMDEKVRETHEYLSGDSVDINERFYTFDGDSALTPGGFELPENNVNCRCWLSYSYK